MNERIKELAEQCRIEECNSIIGDLIEFGIDVGDLNEFGFDYEKFAELIVQECISSISAHRAEAIDLNLTVEESFSLLTRDITQHFGVE
jgi:hypothetical protein